MDFFTFDQISLNLLIHTLSAISFLKHPGTSDSLILYFCVHKSSSRIPESQTIKNSSYGSSKNPSKIQRIKKTASGRQIAFKSRWKQSPISGSPWREYWNKAVNRAIPLRSDEKKVFKKVKKQNFLSGISF